MSDKKIRQSALSIPVLFEKTGEFTCEDGRFTNVKIWLMHLGENLNKSIFEKDVVDEAISTLAYIPIVGFIEKNKSGDDDFSDHRYVITRDDNGVRRKYKGVAYGVVKSAEDNNAHYENRMDDDGVERTYLVCEGIMWDMFEESSNIMHRDIIKSQSMELDEHSIEGYEDENGIYHFTKFSFRAACVLGQDYQPAMVGSTVEVMFTMSDFVRDLQSELSDKYSTFTKIVNEKLNQGGIGNMANTDFTQTLLEMFDDISNVVRSQEAMIDRWGDPMPRFYLADVQDNEVIVVDRKNNYNYYGFSFTMNGDKPEIDFTAGNRKKLRYENYEEGTSVPEGSFDFGKHISEIEEAAFTKVNDANEKAATAEADKIAAEQDKATAETNYSQVKADYDEMKPKYDAYVLADEQRQAAELDAQKDAKFAEFEDVLSENADFTALKERKADLSVDDIEKECAVLYVKVNRTKSNFSKSGNGSAVVGVFEDNGAAGNFVETKYGNIPVKR